MSLMEVRNDIINQQGKELRKRFFHDGIRRCSITIWENSASSKPERFQASLRDHVFEWKNSFPLRYGLLDEGDTTVKMKQSPLMHLNDNINAPVLQELIDYLQEEIKDKLGDLENVLTILKGGFVDNAS